MVWRKAGSAAAFIIAAATLTGCATATERMDHYADRVTTYNKEAELAQDRAILLNVLRTSKRRPLSFFELQSVSAAGTPSGQVGFSIPLAQNGSATPATVSPSFGLSNGPTVAAGYIATQDFYQGILSPISLDTVDFFVQRGISDNLLFNLFFSGAVIRVHQDAKPKSGAMAMRAGDSPTVDDWELHVSNYVGDDASLERYQRLVATLLNAGLSTMPTDPTYKDFGPVLSGAEAANPEFLGKALGGSLKLKAVGWCDLSDAERIDLGRRDKFTPPDSKGACDAIEKASTRQEAEAAESALLKLLPANAPTTFFRLAKKAEDASHAFCFSLSRHRNGDLAPTPIKADLCRTSDDDKSAATASAVPAEALTSFLDDPANRPPCIDKTRKDRCWTAQSYDVEFIPRSTDGVIYYLGEITRRANYPDDNPRNNPGARITRLQMGPSADSIPSNDCNGPAAASEPQQGRYACKALFDLREVNASPAHFLSVSYDGKLFAVPDDSGQASETNEVLDIVSELIALNRSSKDAPSSNLVTLVGH